MTEDKDRADYIGEHAAEMASDIAEARLAEGCLNRRCARSGHKMVEQAERGYVQCGYPREDLPSEDWCIRLHVADRVTRMRTACVRRRCNEVTAWKWSRRKGVDSLSMSESRWDLLDANGWVKA